MLISQCFLTELGLEADTGRVARLSLTSSLLNQTEALESNNTLNIFTIMLAGISRQEAAKYLLAPPDTEDQLNIEKWNRWKVSVETLGARNH